MRVFWNGLAACGLRRLIHSRRLFIQRQGVGPDSRKNLEKAFILRKLLPLQPHPPGGDGNTHQEEGIQAIVNAGVQVRVFHIGLCPLRENIIEG